MNVSNEIALRLRGELVDEVHVLRQSGVDPMYWGKRLGKTATTLQRTLYRAGERELASVLSHTVWRERVERERSRGAVCPVCKTGRTMYDCTTCSRACYRVVANHL